MIQIMVMYLFCLKEFSENNFLHSSQQGVSWQCTRIWKMTADQRNIPHHMRFCQNICSAKKKLRKEKEERMIRVMVLSSQTTVMQDEAEISCKWLNIYLLMRRNEWIPYLALFVFTVLLYLLNCPYLMRHLAFILLILLPVSTWGHWVAAWNLAAYLG